MRGRILVCHYRSHVGPQIYRISKPVSACPVDALTRRNPHSPLGADCLPRPTKRLKLDGPYRGHGHRSNPPRERLREGLRAWRPCLFAVLKMRKGDPQNPHVRARRGSIVSSRTDVFSGRRERETAGTRWWPRCAPHAWAAVTPLRVEKQPLPI